MTLIRNIFGVLFKLYFGFLFGVTLLLLYPLFLVLLSKQKWFFIAFKIKRVWAWVLCNLSGIFVKIEGRDNIPLDNKPIIVCANHASYIDIVMMYRVIPHYFIFMGKAELLNWPLFSIFFRKEMDIAVARSSVTASHRSMQIACDRLKRGESIAIFPEGAIPLKDKPKMIRFKNGAFKMAVEQNVELLPITFVNNWRLFSDPEKPFNRAHPGIAKVVIHQLIKTEGLKDKDLVTLREQTKSIIEGPLLKYYEDR